MSFLKDNNYVVQFVHCCSSCRFSEKKDEKLVCIKAIERADDKKDHIVLSLGYCACYQYALGGTLPFITNKYRSIWRTEHLKGVEIVEMPEAEIWKSS